MYKVEYIRFDTSHEKVDELVNQHGLDKEYVMEEIIIWFLNNPWASFIGMVVAGVQLRIAHIKGYGE